MISCAIKGLNVPLVETPEHCVRQRIRHTLVLGRKRNALIQQRIL